MNNDFKIFIALLITVPCLIFYGFYKYESEHPCIKSHIEKQWEAPMYMQPGKYGGLSIPLNNGRWVDVEVCDQRQ